MFKLNHEEIQKFPYNLITETMYGGRSDKAKKLIGEMFDREERQICGEIIRKAKKWSLKTGAPESVEMSDKEYELWNRLANLCMEL